MTIYPITNALSISMTIGSERGHATGLSEALDSRYESTEKV
jgi:hypothetical protein